MEVLERAASLVSQVSWSPGKALSGVGISDGLAQPEERQRWFLKETAHLILARRLSS